ncbi:MAG: efflux RND transporter permease subunit [Deltaproteobacteria bacterium]
MLRALTAAALLLASCGKHREAVVASPRDTIAISLTSEASGISADELERSVTRPLELEVSQVPNLVALHSRTSVGHSVVIAEFPAGTDAYAASEAVMKAAQNASRVMAPELGVAPMITRESRAGAVLRVTLTSETLPLLEVATIARELLAQKLERVDGVGKVEICGPEPETRITVDPVALASAGKTIDDVRAAIQDTGSSAGLADVTNLAADAPPSYAELEIVRDTARVETRAVGASCVALAGDGRAVALTVTPRTGADPLEIREHLEALLPKIEAELPAAVHVDLWPRTRPLAFQIILDPAAPLARRLDDFQHVVAELHLATRSLVQLGMDDRDPDVADLRIVPPDHADDLEASVIATLERHHLTLRDRHDHIVGFYGADPGAQQHQVEALATAVAGVRELRVVEQIGGADHPHLELKIDRDRASLLEVDVSVVAATLRALAPGGTWLTTTNSQTESTRVMLAVQGELPAVLDQLRVRSRTGNFVPLSSLVTATQTREPLVIFREGSQRWFGVRVAGSLDALNDVLAKLPVPVGMKREVREPD